MPGRGDSVANRGIGSPWIVPPSLPSRSPTSSTEFTAGGRNLDAKTDPQASVMTPKQWHHMAYYYCKRAREVLYASLAIAQHTSPEVRRAKPMCSIPWVSFWQISS